MEPIKSYFQGLFDYKNMLVKFGIVGRFTTKQLNALNRLLFTFTKGLATNAFRLWVEYDKTKLLPLKKV